jgi:phenylacetate-CoA ligase
MSGNIINEYSPWDSCFSQQKATAVNVAQRAWGNTAYRKRWGAAGFSSCDISASNWSTLPMLTKESLLESVREAPPFGDRLGVPRADIAHIFVAPGPFYMPFTSGDMEQVVGSFAKALSACGFTHDDFVDQTTMYNWVIAATAIDLALHKIGCAVVPGGVGQSDRHIEIIQHLNINAIVAFPTFLEHLLEQASSMGLQLPLKKAAVMGELSDPKAKVRMQEKFGLTVREFYGVADVGAVAWECSQSNGMHLRDDLLVEFITPGGTEAVQPKPGSPAELVVTDLHRTAMPIIRLRTGDLIDELKTEPCPCGRSSPRFLRIVGRASEITKVKGMFVVPRLVSDVMRQQGTERPYRLVVDRIDGRDQLLLEIVGEPIEAGEIFKGKVEQALRIKIEMSFVESLPEGSPQLIDRRFRSEA